MMNHRRSKRLSPVVAGVIVLLAFSALQESAAAAAFSPRSLPHSGARRFVSVVRPSTVLPPSTSWSSIFMAEQPGDSDASSSGQQTASVSGLSKSPLEEGSMEELLYALGVNLARQLGDVRPLVNDGQELAHVAKGLLDTVVGRLTDDEQRTLLARRGKELNSLIQQRADAIRQQLEEAGRQMLEQMAKEEGAVTLPSGVVVHVLEAGPEGPGHGVRPTKSSTVKIHYHGTLADGTTFDSTLVGGGPDGKSPEPVQFPLAGVIPGWRDGVLKMHEGETAMVGIPPDQAYGNAGTPDGRIPPGSTLFFKIQLLEVMSAGIGGTPKLLGADGQQMKKAGGSGGGLLGADGKPL